MYKKNVSTLGKIKCSQKSVYSCILPFMFLGLRNTCRFGPLTFYALLTLFALLLSVHQWLRSAIRDSQQPTSPIGFLFLKLPPPPCAVLLVNKQMWMIQSNDKLMPNSCLGQNLLVNHHGIAVSRNSCLSHA